MRWFVALLIGVIALSDIMSWQMSLAPGMSVKNVALYLLLFAIMFRTALHGIPASETPLLHMIFVVWVGYAMASWLVAALVIKYPEYHLVENAIGLKADLIDSVMYFLLAFHGLRNSEDVRFVFKALAAAMGVASVATLLDVAHIVHLGMTIGHSGQEEGRVFGVFGHANDTAALINGLLPVSVAVALGSQGTRRTMWFGFALATMLVFLLTISRGGYVAMLLGSMVAAFMCRRLLPIQRIAGWAAGAGATLIALVMVAGLASSTIGALITDRLFNSGRSAGELSSGRTDIWLGGLRRMLAEPITFITGYGWDVWYVMPFRFIEHNIYLHYWFNLGLVGLFAFIAVIVIVLRASLRAAAATHGVLRPYHISVVFGICMLGIAVFFCNLSGHWAFFWIYLGAGLRAARITLAEPVVSAPAAERIPFGAMRPMRTFANTAR